MSGWRPKRFWKSVTVEACEGGFAIKLDARQAKTPGKAPLVAPTEGLARAIAAEWDAQQGPLKPETMPFTRAANSAIEKVTAQFDEVVGLLAAYGGTDLLCYRATHPQELVTRQTTAWDPLIDWAAAELDAPLTVTQGIVHVTQPVASTRRLHALTAALTPFQIAAFHDLVALSGSLILAFAVTRGRLSPADAWTISRIDETYQAEVWGIDDDAAALADSKRLDFHQAAAFWTLCAPL
jgi:chaperone required for assembly of F1-ATPase